jgi:hypothetical protein
MASIKVRNTDSENLEFATISIFDSSGKKLTALKTNKDGEATIDDSYLQDKGGKIVVSSAEYESATIPISQFSGNAYLKRIEKTLGEVIIVRKKPKPKVPIKITNPFENSDVVKRDDKKRKSPVVPIVLGGIGLAALLLLLTTKMNVK